MAQQWRRLTEYYADPAPTGTAPAAPTEPVAPRWQGLHEYFTTTPAPAFTPESPPLTEPEPEPGGLWGALKRYSDARRAAGTVRTAPGLGGAVLQQERAARGLPTGHVEGEPISLASRFGRRTVQTLTLSPQPFQPIPTAETIPEQMVDIAGSVAGLLPAVYGAGLTGGRAAVAGLHRLGGVALRQVGRYAPNVARTLQTSPVAAKIGQLLLGAGSGVGTGATIGTAKEVSRALQEPGPADLGAAVGRVAQEAGYYGAYGAVYPAVRPGVEAVLRATGRRLPPEMQVMLQALQQRARVIPEAARGTLAGGTAGAIVGTGAEVYEAATDPTYDRERFRHGVAREAFEEMSEELSEAIALAIVRSVFPKAMQPFGFRRGETVAQPEAPTVAPAVPVPGVTPPTPEAPPPPPQEVVAPPPPTAPTPAPSVEGAPPPEAAPVRFVPTSEVTPENIAWGIEDALVRSGRDPERARRTIEKSIRDLHTFGREGGRESAKLWEAVLAKFNQEYPPAGEVAPPPEQPIRNVQPEGIPGGVFRHFTTPAGKRALEAGEAFDFNQLPQHGTGGLGLGPRTGRFLGDFLYLSLDDARWSKATKEVAGEIVPATEENRKKGTLFYDYDQQRWMVNLGGTEEVPLVPVQYRIAPEARVLTIDSPEALRRALAEVGARYWEAEETWEAWRQQYDAIAILNVKQYQHPDDHKFFVAAAGDQLVVLNPAITSVVPAAQAPPPAAPEPAPEPEPEPLPPVQPVATGARQTVRTERGTAVEADYAIVEAADLIPSHDTKLKRNPRFPPPLQPRERARAASEEQVQRIMAELQPEFLGESPKASEGAPIIGPDGVVESGNARVIALSRAYQRRHANAQRYREWLVANAERFGLAPEAIQQAKAPVLVRVRQTDVDRVRFTQEANEAAVAAMSATEQAQVDAEKLTDAMLALFAPDDTGEVLTAANRPFIEWFMREVVGPAERGRYVTAEGAISQEGVRRVRNAVFAKAYGDVRAIEQLAESTDDNVKNITQAMLIAAPRLAQVKELIRQGHLHPLDITPDVAAAMQKLSVLRSTGLEVEAYLQQVPLLGEELTPEGRAILEVFHTYRRSRKRLAEFLLAYADAVEAAGNPQQASFFGQSVPTKADALKATVNVMEVRYAEPEAGPGLFGDESRGRAPAGGAPAGEVAAGGGGAQPRLAGEPSGPRALRIGAGDEAALRTALQTGFADILSLTIAPDASLPADLATEVARTLRADGWALVQDPDGSLRLLPPSGVVSEQPAPYAGAKIPTYRGPLRAGESPAIRETHADLVRELAPPEGSVPPGRGAVPGPGRADVPEEPGGVRTLALGTRPELVNELALSGKVSFEGKVVQNADDLAALAQVVRDPRYETFWFFYVKDGRIVAFEAMTSRLPGAASPYLRGRARGQEKMRSRLRRLGADGYWILHNHPGGKMEASAHDLALTYDLANEVPGLQGHVILDSGEYVLIEARSGERGLALTTEVKPLAPEAVQGQEAFTPSIEHPALGHEITDEHSMAALGRSLKTPENYVLIAYRDSRGRVRALQEIPVALFAQPTEAANYLRGRARVFGGADLVAYYDGPHDLVDTAALLIEMAVLRDFITEARILRGQTELRPGISTRALRGIRDDSTMVFGRPARPLRVSRVREELARYGNTVGPAGFVAAWQRAGGAVVTAPAPPSAPKRAAIVRYLAAKFGVPVREGKITNPMALGIYKTREEVIRNRKLEDLSTLAHEVGHHLDKQLGLQQLASIDDLRPLGRVTAPKKATVRRLRQEGVAEFMRILISEGDAAAQHAAPRYYAEFMARLQQAPEVLEGIRVAQQLYHGYLRAPAAQKIRSVIAFEPTAPEERPTFRRRFWNAYTAWVDDLAAVQQAQRRLTGGRRLPADQDPYLLARRARGVPEAVEELVFGRTRRGAPGGQFTGPSLESILRPIQKDPETEERYWTYAVARRVVELANRGFSSERTMGITRAEAQEAIRKLETPEFQEVQRKRVAFMETVLRHYAAAGFLTDDQLQTILRANRDWVPFFREAREGGAGGRGRPGGPMRLANIGPAVRRIRGGMGTIIHPLDGHLRQVHTLMQMAAHNRAGRALTALARDAEGFGWLIEGPLPASAIPVTVTAEDVRDILAEVGARPEDVDPDVVATIFRQVNLPTFADAQNRILRVYEDGKPRFYQVDPEEKLDADLYAALLSLDAEATNIMIRVLSPFARILRATVTIVPEFIWRNILRDTAQAAVYGRGVPGEAVTRGLFEVFRKGELYRRWRLAGGATSAQVSVDRDSLREMRRRFRKAVPTPNEVLRALSSHIEAATRVGEFAMAVQGRGGPAVSDALAAIESRDITIDFQRAGGWGRAWNKVAAFFNPAVQDLDKFVRMHFNAKTGPRAALRGLLYLTLPTVLLYLANRDDPLYEELPQWRRDLFWNIRVGDGFVPIPIPHVLGFVYKVLPERIMRFIDQEDPRAFAGLAPTAGAVLVPNFIPTALALLAELKFNWSFFQDRPIVPEREQRLPAELQYGTYTTETAKLVGRAIGASPRKVEHAVRGLTGGVGQYSLLLLDTLLKGAGVVDPPPRRRLATGLERAMRIEPVLGSGSASIEEFYRILEDAERAYAGLRKRIEVATGASVDMQKLSREQLEVGQRLVREMSADERKLLRNLKEIRRLERILSQARRARRAVEERRDLSPARKTEMVQKIDRTMTNIVRAFFGKRKIASGE